MLLPEDRRLSVFLGALLLLHCVFATGHQPEVSRSRQMQPRQALNARLRLKKAEYANNRVVSFKDDSVLHLFLDIESPGEAISFDLRREVATSLSQANLFSKVVDQRGAFRVVDSSFVPHTFSSLETSSTSHASLTFSPMGHIFGSLLFNGALYDFDTKIPTNHNQNLGRNLEGLTDELNLQVELKTITIPELNPSKIRGLQQLDENIRRWENCYPGDEAPHFLDIGIASDNGYFRRFGTIEATLAHMQSFITSTNIVYSSQFNVFLRVKQVVIVPDFESLAGSQDETLSFFGAGQSSEIGCEPSANELLVKFSGWVERFNRNGDPRVEPVDQGLWHFLTDCFQSGTVGSAFSSVQGGDRGTICRGDAAVNTGVTSITARGFVSFAHEIGHNLGAGHSFENGEGRTGGIMDNGDGTFEGVVQFREERRPEICEGLTRAATNSRCSSQFFTPFDSVCAFSIACDTGLCQDGICVEMNYRTTIDGSEFSHSAADENLAKPISQFNSIVGSVDSVREFAPSNIFACEPFSSNVNPSGGSAFLIVNDKEDNENSCSFLDKALNVRARGYSGMILFDEDADPGLSSIKVAGLTQGEINSGTEPLEDFAIIYVESALGKSIRAQGEALSMEVGWFSEQNNLGTFTQITNITVGEAPSDNMALYVTIAGVVLISLGAVGVLATLKYSSSINLPKRPKRRVSRPFSRPKPQDMLTNTTSVSIIGVETVGGSFKTI